MKKNEYQCESCGGIFEKEQSDECAQKEAAKIFGEYAEDMAIVCDDCYKKIMKNADAFFGTIARRWGFFRRLFFAITGR